jgi:hypothetical protein
LGGLDGRQEHATPTPLLYHQWFGVYPHAFAAGNDDPDRSRDAEPSGRMGRPKGFTCAPIRLCLAVKVPVRLPHHPAVGMMRALRTLAGPG